ncbi:MAG TPA: hypothetical protein VJI73_00220 [Candidatus Paceibacterota bacterium]
MNQGQEDPKIESPDSVDEIGNMDEIEKAYEKRKKDERDALAMAEVLETLKALDAAGVEKAGGHAQFLEGQIQQRRKILEEALRGKPEKMQELLRKNIEKTITPLEHALKYLNRDENKKS